MLVVGQTLESWGILTPRLEMVGQGRGCIREVAGVVDVLFPSHGQRACSSQWANLWMNQGSLWNRCSKQCLNICNCTDTGLWLVWFCATWQGSYRDLHVAGPVALAAGKCGLYRARREAHWMQSRIKTGPNGSRRGGDDCNTFMLLLSYPTDPFYFYLVIRICFCP